MNGSHPNGSPNLDSLDINQRTYLRNIRWRDFQAIARMRGEGSVPRLAYLDGVLELMSPSTGHEWNKTLIARLIEAWADYYEVDLGGIGSLTVGEKRKESAVEPDECYVLGTEPRDVPDFAIEVHRTETGLDKLEIYRRLGVREVWVWKHGKLSVYQRKRGGYALRRGSGLLPELDLDLLSKYVWPADQRRAVREYRSALARRRRH
ncbi:MAG: Uma2 family endonuclease [Myxococcales bacterium]|nr:Uma2 family endonuclease [Myxococcales bacterium]